MLKITVRLLPVLPVLLSLASPLHAGLTDVDLFKNIAYTQTSGAAPTTPAGFFASLRAFEQNAGDFSSVSVAYPGPASPQALSPNGTEFIYQTPFLPTSVAMDAQYPFGTYTFQANGAVNETANIIYTTDAYTADIPALSAATFAALQGMNPANSFTFNFNSFTPNPSASVGLTFLTVFGTPFSASYPNSTTSVVMGANTLLPNTTYTYELDFSDRISGSDSGVPTTVGFDVRTDGTFTTAAISTATPEPGSLTLAALGAALLALGMRRRVA
jgi:PEP-CTERM motif